MEFQLPTANDIVNKNYNNKAKLTQDVQDLLDIISDLYNDALKGQQTNEIERKYQEKISDLELIISKKDKTIAKLENEIDDLFLASENPLIRKELGLKDNLISINKNNIKNISKSIDDIEEEYEGLFD